MSKYQPFLTDITSLINCKLTKVIMHAYCIIAHSDPYCLQSLIKLIDDKRNDIIIVYDKKSSPNLFSSIEAEQSQIITPPHSQLIDIQWGNRTQIAAELLAFETALRHGNYEYIHLISGADLPIKNQDYIHDYFEKLPIGTNMIGFDNSRDYSERVMYYHIATRFYRSHNKIIKTIFDVLRGRFLQLQKRIGFKRDWSDMNLYKGTNWVSITPDFARFLVDNRDFILSKFRMTYCPDEVYKQTMIMNSSFKETIFDTSLNAGGGTRIIDWKRGNPYVWRFDDFESLCKAPELFARKFDSNIDRSIIDAMVEYVKSMN